MELEIETLLISPQPQPIILTMGGYPIINSPTRNKKIPIPKKKVVQIPIQPKKKAIAKNIYVPRKKIIKNNAGVMLIERYCTNNDGRIEPALILFEQRRTYSDGGGCQKPIDNNTRDTATRELLEESCNLFRINPDILNQKHSVLNENYTCYFVGINNEIKTEYFDKNLQIIKQTNAPRDWREINSIRKFYVSDVKKMDICHNGILYNVPDINGKLLNLNSRAKRVFYDASVHIENDLEFVTMNENMNYYDGNNNFVNGTICYSL